jgi:enoyl-CoA hydratase/carnithine racemase
LTPPLATITLRRPEAGNRINQELAEELRDICGRLRHEPSVHLTVLTGTGDTFSTGRADLPEGLTPAERETWLAGMRVAPAVADLPMPVLVALNGDTLDHGLELALAGDLRIAVAGARLGITDLAQPGQRFPWDGGTQRLPRLIGPGWATDLILTSRLVDADQARALGLVNLVAPRQEFAGAVAQLCQSLLQAGPIASRYAREAIRQGQDLSLDQGLRLEADLNIILQSTTDRAEGLLSFKQKRPPRFTGQ